VTLFIIYKNTKNTESDKKTKIIKNKKKTNKQR